MQAHGVKFIRPAVPSRIEKLESGRLLVTYSSGSEEHQEEYDTVLFAIGREINPQAINLASSGVQAEPNGKIRADAEERTNVPHIYAIGDVLAGKLELTPVAIKAGKLLAQRLFANGTERMDYELVPTCVFTPLEYGSCGLSEEDAKARFGAENIKTYHTTFNPLEWNLVAVTSQRVGGSAYVKVLVNALDNNRVVGFHLLSPNAGDVTQGVAIALSMGATKEQFDKTVGIHPTIAEDVIGLHETKEDNPNATKTSC